MATYTVELRKLCEIYSRETVESWFKDYELSDYLLPDQLKIVENTSIWNKDRLAKKIVDHYFMREIGFETPELFKHYVKITMKEIMESKLPLIYTNAIEYDPLVNVDYTETFKRSANGENVGSSKSNAKNNASGLNINSDTPQGQINKQDILNGNYATSTSSSETESNINDETSTNSAMTNNEEYSRHFKGNQGISASYQAMIKQFRENIVSIDKDIIEELQSLFMGLY